VSTNGKKDILRLNGIDTYYGEIHILENLDLNVEEGELVSLLGGNASGKSTTLKTILGLVQPRNTSVATSLPGRCRVASSRWWRWGVP
jgi:branched-chain amino acid transport system ATP-binding protein